jgi:hypothetical protein
MERQPTYPTRIISPAATTLCNASVAHFSWAHFLICQLPGVPLRSTPGFTLPPALRVQPTFARKVTARSMQAALPPHSAERLCLSGRGPFYSSRLRLGNWRHSLQTLISITTERQSLSALCGGRAATRSTFRAKRVQPVPCRSRRISSKAFACGVRKRYSIVPDQSL